MAASAVPTSPGRKRLLYFGESFDGANAYSPSPVGSAASSALHLVAVAAGRLHLLALSSTSSWWLVAGGWWRGVVLLALRQLLGLDAARSD